MKYLNGMMALCLAIALTVPSLAAGEAKITELSLAPTFSYYTWKEKSITGSQIVKETGPLFGIGSTLRADLLRTDSGQSLTLSGKLDVYGGVVNYEGFQNLTNLPVSTDVGYFGTRLECDAGWGFPVMGSTVGPFAGFSYRFWLRDLNSSTTFDGKGNLVPVSGVTEYWNDVGTRLGVRWLDISPAPGWRFFAEGGLQYSLYVSNSSDIGYGSVTLEPESMWAPFAEAGVRYRQFRFAVTYEELRYGRSPSVIAGPYFVTQPASTGEYIGFSLGYLFK